MTSEKQGAAHRQANRPVSSAAHRRSQYDIVADREDWSFKDLAKHVGQGILFALLFYALMWLAAGY